MRDSIPTPVALDFTELLNTFSVKKSELKNLALRDGGCVKGGFTFESNGCVFYGVESGNLVNVFGIDEFSEVIPDVVVEFMKTNNLRFINWHDTANR